MSSGAEHSKRANNGQTIFKTAFTHANIGMAFLDPAGTIRSANGVMAHLLGYSEPNSIEDCQLSDFFSDEAWSQFDLDQLLDGSEQQRAYHQEVGIQTADETTKKVRLSAHFLGSADSSASIFLQAEHVAPSLPHSLVKYKELAQSTELAVAILDENNKIQWINEGYRRSTGLTPHQVRGKTPQYISKHLLNGQIEEGDIDQIGINGTDSSTYTFWFEDYQTGENKCHRVHTTPVMDNGQNCIGAISIGTDITNQAKYEQRLHKLKQAIDASINGIAILDDQLHYAYVNSAHADIYGYESPDALLGKSWQILYEEKEIERIQGQIKQSLMNNGHWRGEAVGKRKDGKTFNQELSLTLTEQGDTICVVRDITEHKNLLSRLERQNENLEFAQKLAEIGFWYQNVTTGESGMSEGAARLFGIPPEEAAEYNFEDHLNLINEEDQDKLNRAISRLEQEGEPFDIIYRISRVDNGDLRYIENMGTKHQKGPQNQKIYFGVYQDVTAMKKRQEEIQESRDAIKTMLQEVHHRVKNNLATISGLLELQTYSIDQESANDALENSLLRIKSMAQVHETLYKSPSLSDINLQDYIDGLAQAVKDTHMHSGKDIALEVSIAPDITINLKQAVPTALLANELIINAFEHAFPRKDEGQITLTANQAGNRIKLQVRDNGQGLDREQWENSESLGHSIIRSICQQLGADLDISVDNGTIFTVSFNKE